MNLGYYYYYYYYYSSEHVIKIVTLSILLWLWLQVLMDDFWVQLEGSFCMILSFDSKFGFIYWGSLQESSFRLCWSDSTIESSRSCPFVD